VAEDWEEEEGEGRGSSEVLEGWEGVRMTTTMDSATISGAAGEGLRRRMVEMCCERAMEKEGVG